ncbi:glycosyltransferase family 4 protein [Thermodesulfobacteriota bacterium]
MRIGLVSYRTDPHCGGQGVYIQNLSRALRDIGHHVDVISGPPYPQSTSEANNIHLPCLDLYNPENLFRMPGLRELCSPTNLIEWLGVSTAGFPEPFTFGLRAYQFLRNMSKQYDIIHDNQSLSYGIWAITKLAPTIATIHHPITVDRDLAIKAAGNLPEKIKEMRWHSFIGMQKRVSRTFSHIITVSKFARNDICKDFKIPLHRFRIVPNGINTELFFPLPGIRREKNRIIVTNSSDTPLKGLRYLLRAVSQISRTQEIKMTIVGKPHRNSETMRLMKDLDIGNLITFTGRIDHNEFVHQYAKATVAVIPSLYEGFGFPVGEAMACGVPVISTTGGALPEVVGKAGILVPPADHEALTRAIKELLADPARARHLGLIGYERVRRHFTWRKAAERTTAVYREAIRDHR